MLLMCLVSCFGTYGILVICLFNANNSSTGIWVFNMLSNVSWYSVVFLPDYRLWNRTQFTVIEPRILWRILVIILWFSLIFWWNVRCVKECCNIPDRVIILESCAIGYFNPWLLIATVYGILILDITTDAEWWISDTDIDY
jgi:hypothetical protein